MKPSSTRWNPARELEQWQSQFAALGVLESFRPGGEGDRASAEWNPRVDIIENKTEFILQAEMPALTREDVRVRLANGVLTISGERRPEKRAKDRTCHRVECAYGTFFRSFTLPPTTSGAKVAAEFKDGLLQIRLPKDTKTARKIIPIKVR